MQQLNLFWMTLDTRRRALLLGGAAALLVVLVILSRLASTPSYVLLYAGLDPTAAGEVIAALEARGVAHSVRGDAIYVDQAERDALRMSLAGDGLPANGAAGYELLDSLSGFGTTSQMFDAAYWRAKEGELARTILASPRIRAARVHLANPGNDPFRDRAEVTASVTLRPAAGGVSTAHAQALRYLVASSVPGLLPENVTVIDADSGQVLSGEEMVSPSADATGRAEEMRRNIERLLAARVGPGNAVVEVSVELTTARETLVERRIDPESRVVVATDTEERSDSSRDAAGGAVTVASNLPTGDAAGEGEGSASQASETRERVTFDMSEMQREVENEPGAIRRISVAVLVNGVAAVNADGLPIVEPRSAEELAALESLVRSAVGFDAERGDQVTIQSMEFEPVLAGPLAEAQGGLFSGPLDLTRLIQMALLGAVALALVFGLLRPLLTGAAREPDGAGIPSLAPARAAPALTGGTPGAAAAEAGAGPARLDPATALPGPTRTPGQAEAAPVARDGEVVSDDDPAALPAMRQAEIDPVERLRRLIEEREAETVEILRSWMEEDEEQA